MDATVHRRVLITGAGRNIGERLARDFAADGHEVLLVSRRAGMVDEVAESIQQDGGRALSAACDVTDQAATRRLPAALGLDDDDPGVDVLVNCAMVRVQQPFLHMGLQEWSSVLDVVLTGAFTMTQLCLPGMQARGWGRIVNFAGLAAQAGAVNRAGIVTAKAGLIGFTKAIALEAAPFFGVTVNAVSPGIIDTQREPEPGTPESVAALSRRHYAEEQEQIPLRRMGTAEEVTAAVRYLASDAAGFTTGQVLNVNGGRYLG